MKNRIYLLLILSTLTINVFAQNESNHSNEKRFSFGVYGGLNFQNINGTNANGAALANSLVPRFTLGINEEIYIVPEFYGITVKKWGLINKLA